MFLCCAQVDDTSIEEVPISELGQNWPIFVEQSGFVRSGQTCQKDDTVQWLDLLYIVIYIIMLYIYIMEWQLFSVEWVSIDVLFGRFAWGGWLLRGKMSYCGWFCHCFNHRPNQPRSMLVVIQPMVGWCSCSNTRIFHVSPSILTEYHLMLADILWHAQIPAGPAVSNTTQSRRP